VRQPARHGSGGILPGHGAAVRFDDVLAGDGELRRVRAGEALALAQAYGQHHKVRAAAGIDQLGAGLGDGLFQLLGQRRGQNERLDLAAHGGQGAVVCPVDGRNGVAGLVVAGGVRAVQGLDAPGHFLAQAGLPGEQLVRAGPHHKALRHRQAQAVFYLAKLCQARAHKVGLGCVQGAEVGRQGPAGGRAASAQHFLHLGGNFLKLGLEVRGALRRQGLQVLYHPQGVDDEGRGAGAQKGHAEDAAIGGGAFHVGQGGKQALASGEQQAEVGVPTAELRADALGLPGVEDGTGARPAKQREQGIEQCGHRQPPDLES